MSIEYASEAPRLFPYTHPRETPDGCRCAWLMPQGGGAGAILREELGYRPQSPVLYAGIRDGTDTNPGLTTGFAKYRSNETLSSDPAGHVNRGLKCICPGAGVEGVLNAIAYSLPAVVGQSWSLSAWVNTPVGISLRLLLMNLDSSGNPVSGTTVIEFTGTGTYQWVAGTGTMNNAATAFAGFRTDTSVAQAVTFYADDISLLRTDLSTAHGAIGGALWGTKRLGARLEFDGTDDRVKVLGDPIGTTSNLTIMTWVYLRGWGTSTLPRILTNSECSLYCFQTDGVARLARAGDGGTYASSANGSIGLGQWYHIAAVIRGSTATLYIKGVQSGTANQACGTPTAGRDTYLGNRYGAALYDRPLNGYIGNTYIVPRAMPQGEIQQWFRREASEYGVTV